MGVDKELELCTALKEIEHVKIIGVENLLEYRLRNMQQSWATLATLVNALLIDADSQKDLYEIISYFLNSTEPSPKLTITNTTTPYIALNGALYHPIPYTENDDLNLILSTMRFHPSHIIIKNQDLLSPSLLNAFKNLGNKKEPH